jgi:hypothetical protein
MSSLNLRPSVIVEVARWWRQCLSTAEQQRETLTPADISEVEAMFQCSTEEAIRGICIGEQLYWGGTDEFLQFDDQQEGSHVTPVV